MNSSPIDPILIPHFTGDISALERDVTALAKDASNVRTTGANTHSTFQGLSAWYEAPERGQLLDSTLPVRDKADHFADGLETVKSALATYASAIRPIVKELDSLREQAVAFRAEIGDSDRWRKDQSKIDRNAHLIQAVTVAQEKFHAAERDAFNKITGVFDKSLRLTVDDGTHKKGMYGYDPTEAGKATKTPWGEVEKRDYDGLEAAWHWTADATTNVVKGFFVDGLGNAAKGLYHLVNFTDGKTFKESWSSLGTTTYGIGLYATKPFDMVFDQTMFRDKDGPDEIRAKKAAREFGKSFIAYDEWKTNPSRAGGTVAFNVLTLAAGPLLKAGMAGKAGQAGAAGEAGGTAAAAAKAAKAATALGTVGRYVDPVTYVQKATGLTVEATKLAIPKIGDIASEVRQSLGRIGARNPSSVELPPVNGKPQYLHPDGTIRDATGIKHPGAEAPKEPSKHELSTPREATTTADRRVMAHSGGRAADSGSGAGRHAGSTDSGFGSGKGSAGGHAGGAGHGGHSGPGGGSGAGHGDDAGKGSGDDAGTSAGGGDDAGKGAGSGTGDTGSGSGDHTPPGTYKPSPGEEVPHLRRQDENFSDPRNKKNQRKSYINEDGDLVPANPDGDATIVDHIVGVDPAKSDSPYTSTSRDGAEAKNYGGKTIRIDLPKLRADIASGKVKGVEVYSPEQVEAAIQAAADKTAGYHIDLTIPPKTPRPKARKIAEKLGFDKETTAIITQRMMDMMHTRRDAEWLIKGVVPSEYITGPF
ncbi:hypothetical protein AB0K89_27810 [Streptomyces cinnamoneus]|uniref:hypothetical protein n=1 Tax=Streptomyces cinnamoneus TaxID=53446 RepID=UPI0034390C8E